MGIFKRPQVRKQVNSPATLTASKCRHWSSVEQSNASINGSPGAVFSSHKRMGPLTKKDESYAQFLYKERQLVVNSLWWWERAKVYQGTLISFCVPLRPFLTCLLTFIRPHYSPRLMYKLFNSLASTMGTNEERARIKFRLSFHHFKVQQYTVLNRV